MTARTPPAPLRSGAPTGRAGRPTDPAAAVGAYPWSDGSLPKRKLAFTTNETVADRTMPEIRARAVAAVARSGFPVVLDGAPELPPLLRDPPAGVPVEGIVVGERGLRIDPARRRTALVRTLASVVLMGVGIVGFALYWATELFLVATLPLFVGVFGVMWFGPAYGSFDSEVVFVAYSASVRTEAAIAEPRVIRVTVGAGTVASANWASKSGSGRSFKQLLPDADDLRDVPAEILSEVLAGPPTVTPGP